jgi:hypothetical protein
MATRKQRRKRATRSSSEPRRPRRSTRGPLSLKEAQAAVLAQHAVTKPLERERAALLRRLGAQRRKLDQKRRTELRRRRKAYEDAYRLLAARGIQTAAPPAGASLAAVAPQPLRILAEGDSWFDYPATIQGGVIPRLAMRLGVPIHNLAHAGDEVRYMLGVEQREDLAKELERKVGKGKPYDVLLFSGGGNDIVGDPLCLWVRDWDSSVPPAQHVDMARFQTALGLVLAGYEDLVTIRDATSPTTRILLHAYDFAIPTGEGVCFLGPWLKPSFDLRDFPELPNPASAAVVVEMLSVFRARLAAFAGAHSAVTLVETQQTLTAAEWANELHPTSGGFEKIVDEFHQALVTLYPGRVPA